LLINANYLKDKADAILTLCAIKIYVLITSLLTNLPDVTMCHGSLCTQDGGDASELIVPDLRQDDIQNICCKCAAVLYLPTCLKWVKSELKILTLNFYYFVLAIAVNVIEVVINFHKVAVMLFPVLVTDSKVLISVYIGRPLLSFFCSLRKSLKIAFLLSSQISRQHYGDSLATILGFPAFKYSCFQTVFCYEFFTQCH